MFRVLVPESIDHPFGEVMETFGASVSGIGLLIVTDMLAVLPELFAASTALANSVCTPFVSVVESRSEAYEVADPVPVVPLPTAISSTKNVTPVTPILSVAVAVSFNAPERVLLSVGEVSEIAGGVVSDTVFTIFTVIGAEVVAFSEASLARAAT